MSLPVKRGFHRAMRASAIAMPLIAGGCATVEEMPSFVPQNGELDQTTIYVGLDMNTKEIAKKRVVVTRKGCRAATISFVLHPRRIESWSVYRLEPGHFVGEEASGDRLIATVIKDGFIKTNEPATGTKTASELAMLRMKKVYRDCASATGKKAFHVRMRFWDDHKYRIRFDVPVPRPGG